VAPRAGRMPRLPDERGKLVDGHVGLADREGPGDPHDMVRTFAVPPAELDLRRSHRERAGRQHHHLGTAGAFPEAVPGTNTAFLGRRQWRVGARRQRRRRDAAAWTGRGGPRFSQLRLLAWIARGGHARPDPAPRLLSPSTGTYYRPRPCRPDIPWRT